MAQWRLVQKKKEMDEAIYNSQILNSSTESNFQDEELSVPMVPNHYYEGSQEQNFEKLDHHAAYTDEMHEHHPAYSARHEAPMMQGRSHTYPTGRARGYGDRQHSGDHRYRNEYDERPLYRDNEYDERPLYRDNEYDERPLYRDNEYDERPLYRDGMQNNYSPPEFHNYHYPPGRIYEDCGHSQDGRGNHGYKPGSVVSRTSNSSGDYRYPSHNGKSLFVCVFPGILNLYRHLAMDF